MYRNKVFSVVIAAAVAALVLLLLSRNSKTPVELDSQTKPETKVAPAVRTEPVAKPTAKQTDGDTTSNAQKAGEQSSPTVAEQTDLAGLDDALVDHYSKGIDYMLHNPMHPGRAKLKRQMRNETAKETFLNLVDNDNFAMLMPSMGGYPFSPGNYKSDIVTVSKMTRVRKLLTDARDNPQQVARLLQQQIRTLAAEFPSQYKQFQEDLKKEATQGYLVSSELPSYDKTRILCTAAVYVLSQIDSFDSLPTIAWLYRQGDSKESSSPVNRKFLFYAMHRLVQKSSDSALSAQAKEIRDDYLKKAAMMNIPDPIQLKVSAWDAFYHEDDFRRRLPGSKIDMSLQPAILLERFPILDHLSTRKVEFLLKDLCKFADLS